MAEAEAAAGAGAGQPDAVLLAPLTEDSFLHNLHVRYKRDIIYTYVGNALVSVNPCRALPLYSAELVRAYLARPPYQLPPHLYALTATSYRWVRDRNESQCIVITGESGSGKTEAARVCLQCVVVAGEQAGGAAGGGAALTAAGTLLEAFGNAATIRNHNASRFGKLLEIEFDFKGEPVGGHITHYLLEKERACSVPEGERNFHVLYQLLAGADVQLLKRLKLQRSWEQYRILRAHAPPRSAAASPRRAPSSSAPPSSCSSPAPQPPAAPRDPHRAAQHDVDHFAFTKAAMATLGIGGGECGAVLRLLAFMLKLGNVQFEPQHNIDGSIGTRIQHAYELSEGCALVGVDAAALSAALSAPAHPPHLPDASDSESESDAGSSSSGGGCGGGCGAEWARAALARLLSALYSRLFTWLVRRANAALRRGGCAGATSRTLAVLDVYGFERLARNGLERLLINYAAERVQAAVTGCTLRREQEEYAREGLAWRALPLPEHELLADLLDGGADSVLGALRECSARRLSRSALLQRLQRRRSPRLQVDPPDHFTVVHFGGAVTYNARGMLGKNRDALCRRCGGALAGAREPLLAELFAGSGPDERAAGADSPRRVAALSCRQRALVGALVRRLPASPRLVRCLRADAALRPARWDAALVRHQLRSQGILDMALLRRAGWCESMCARAALQRYAVLAPRRPMPAPPPAQTDAVRAARALLRDLPIPNAEFAFGRTRVFVRSPRTVWELEALRAARVAELVIIVQRAWRRHRARRRSRAQRVIARAWRRLVARRLGPRQQPAGAAVGAAAGAAPIARVRRLAARAVAAAARRCGRAAAPAAPRVALPRVPRALRPDGAQPHAREGHLLGTVPRPQGTLRRERGAPLRGGLRAPARVRGVAARRRRRRPLRGVRGRLREGSARERARGARAVRCVDRGAAGAGGALAARAAPRARAGRVAPLAVAARGRRAGGARAPARRRTRPHAAPVPRRRGARPAGPRAGLPVRGRVAAARRRGAAHVPRAGAGDEAVPRGTERGGRAPAGAHRHRVRGQLRGAGGDYRVPRARRRRRRAPAAPQRPHGRAALAHERAVARACCTTPTAWTWSYSALTRDGTRLLRRNDRTDVLL